MQARFDWVCSWTKMECVSYRPRPYHRLKQYSTFNLNLKKLEFWNMCRRVHMAIIMDPLMWHVSGIPWKAAYGPQIKKMCVL
jgi:hypothetical protein